MLTTTTTATSCCYLLVALLLPLLPLLVVFFVVPAAANMMSSSPTAISTHCKLRTLAALILAAPLTISVLPLLIVSGLSILLDLVVVGVPCSDGRTIAFSCCKPCQVLQNPKHAPTNIPKPAHAAFVTFEPSAFS